MVVDELGEAAWLDLEHDASIGPAELISGLVYDDAVTAKVVAAVARALKLSVEECLKRFGRYWVGFAKQGPYGDIMDFVGRDIAGFIENLDRLHQNVTMVMPKAIVPSFSVIEKTPGHLRVAYSSPRTDLEPFVIGLLHGIMEMFSMTGEVRQNLAGNDTREFLVTFQGG